MNKKIKPLENSAKLYILNLPVYASLSYELIKGMLVFTKQLLL